MAQRKGTHRNILPAFAAVASHTYDSALQPAAWVRGLRFTVTVAGASTTGGNDSFVLCGAVPGGTTLVALVGFTAASLLSVNGTYFFDFYPGAWLPASGLYASGGLVGAAGIDPPAAFAVRLITGANNSATLTVDVEYLP
jgi:hypothetical protein